MTFWMQLQETHLATQHGGPFAERAKPSEVLKDDDHIRDNYNINETI